MFERYTEKARRVIFFARYEASQFGSPYIETEHLLLGLLRESKAVTSKLLSSTATSEETIRKKIESHTTRREKTSTSVDLPLSNESKRVLAYAGEEAERLSHKHIGTEHLFVGLLREKESFGAQLLNEEGVTLAQARETIASCPPDPNALDKIKNVLENLRPRAKVEIHGKRFDLQAIGVQADRLRKFAWMRRQWEPLDVVVSPGGGVCFDLSLADGERYQLKRAGWTKEACAICGWELEAGQAPERSEGFTNGRLWVCAECHHRFLTRSTGAS